MLCKNMAEKFIYSARQFLDLVVYVTDTRKRKNDFNPNQIINFLGVEQYGSRNLRELEELQYESLVANLGEHWRERPPLDEF